MISGTYLNLLTFVFAINEINNSSRLLPNISLGFHIYDSCLDDRRSLYGALSLLSGKKQYVPNFNCEKQMKLISIVENNPASTSASLVMTLGMLQYPQISFTSKNLLAAKSQFYFNYQIAQNEIHLILTVVKIIRYFNWTWIGIISSEDESAMRASQILQTEIQKNGACVEFVALLPLWSNFFKRAARVINILERSSATVIIVYANYKYLLMFFTFIRSTNITFRNKTWILVDEITSISSSPSFANDIDFQFINGSLAFVGHRKEIPGFQDFLTTVNYRNFPEDPYLQDFFEYAFECQWFPHEYALRNCSENDLITVFGDRMSGEMYNIYNGIYALAHAMHEYLFVNTENGVKQSLQHFQPWKLHKHLKKIKFTNTAGDIIYFDENRDFTFGFDIQNLHVFKNNSIKMVKVGTVIPSSQTNEELVINEGTINWNNYNPQIPPHSFCNPSCSSGYRKLIHEGMPICCYSCVACPEGEISNHTDSENCVKCPEDQWPNEEKKECFPKVVTFLSYTETLGASLAIISIVFSPVPVGVLGVFIRHRDTAVVKANNRNLSITILISLVFCFLCPLLFIGRPGHVTCALRQIVFGITFSISVSSILAKTFTVVLAFNVTRPGSRITKLIGFKISFSTVLICSLIQVVICAIWSGVAPPFPYQNMESQIGVIVLECNEGSVTAFCCVLGYLGLLALSSFFVAFLARNLPDSFNEAKYITFSMLVFCSVWIGFIPAYFSTKGKYMVTVEIFAILASSAGLLGCIFIPKCFLILLRPELNTRTHVMIKT